MRPFCLVHTRNILNKIPVKKVYLPCLIIVLSFRYFGTVASAKITDTPILDHSKSIREQEHVCLKT